MNSCTPPFQSQLFRLFHQRAPDSLATLVLRDPQNLNAKSAIKAVAAQSADKLSIALSHYYKRAVVGRAKDWCIETYQIVQECLTFFGSEQEFVEVADLRGF
jgi:hypothetical protein